MFGINLRPPSNPLCSLSPAFAAAHCVQPSANRFPTVHLGRSYLSTPESGYDVRRTLTTAIHGSYNADTSANDLALLLLDAPATKAPVALAAALPPNSSYVTVLGFGTTSEGNPYLSGRCLV